MLTRVLCPVCHCAPEHASCRGFSALRQVRRFMKHLIPSVGLFGNQLGHRLWVKAMAFAISYSIYTGFRTQPGFLSSYQFPGCLTPSLHCFPYLSLSLSPGMSHTSTAPILLLASPSPKTLEFLRRDLRRRNEFSESQFICSLEGK